MVDTKPHNAYYERPATLSLLPDVSGFRAVDAGCGPGVYTEWLIEHGAQVIAFDVSGKMVDLARKRVGNRAEIREADFGHPLDFLPDEAFDLVLSTLALDYVPDWRGPFAEFYRVLRPGGWLVFSIGHPLFDYVANRPANYFETERVTELWRGFGEPYVEVVRYRRSLGNVFDTLLGAGFTLDRFLEARPTEDFKAAAPDDYEVLMRSPGFLCVRARKP